MKPLLFIVVAGLAVAGFVGGRITASRAAGGKVKTPVFANVNGDTAVSAASGGRAASSGGSGASLVRIKSAAELRDELKKLPRARFGQSREFFELQDRLERLGARDIAKLVHEFAQGKMTSSDRQAVQMLAEAMAKKDPEGAWKLSASLQPPLKGIVTSAAIKSLAENFPDTALAKFNSIEDKRQRDSLRHAFISAISKNDPQRALALARENPGPNGWLFANTIFSDWARKDIQAAQAALAGLDDEKTRADARDAIATVLAETDPAAAWQFAVSTGNLPPAGHMIGAYQNILRQWAQLDPESALQAALAVPKNDENNPGHGQRNYFLQFALEGWAESDYNAALQYVIASPDPDVLASGINTLASLPGSDYGMFFDALLDRGPENGYHLRSSLYTLFDRWIGENPQEAAAAVTQLSSEDGNSYISSVLSSWMNKAEDKSEPLQWLLSLPPGQSRSGAFSNILWSSTDWASGSDSAAVVAAAMQLPEAERSSAYYSIASNWGGSGSDIQGAIKWASSLPDSAGIVQNVVSSYARNNPQEAIALMNSLGLANNASLVGNIVREWTKNDLASASTWVRQLPDDDTRNMALSSVASSLASDAPETAVAWAQSINNPAQRTTAIENIVRTWKRYNPKAAEAWVASSNLPSESKNKLLGK